MRRLHQLITWAMNEGRPISSMFLQRQMALKRSRHSVAWAGLEVSNAFFMNSK